MQKKIYRAGCGRKNHLRQENHFDGRIFLFSLTQNKGDLFMDTTKEKDWGKELKEWVISISAAIIIALIIRTFIVELYIVDGPSMKPTLQDAERLVVNRFIYHIRDPLKGEVIVFRYPRDTSRDFIKRVIATAGDTIEIRDGRVYVNDQLQREDYILEKTRTDYPKTTVPEGTLFVCGDNRGNSSDSRFPDVGFLPLENVKGKAVLVFWPIDEFKTL